MGPAKAVQKESGGDPTGALPAETVRWGGTEKAVGDRDRDRDRDSRAMIKVMMIGDVQWPGNRSGGDGIDSNQLAGQGDHGPHWERWRWIVQPICRTVSSIHCRRRGGKTPPTELGHDKVTAF